MLLRMDSTPVCNHKIGENNRAIAEKYIKAHSIVQSEFVARKYIPHLISLIG